MHWGGNRQVDHREILLLWGPESILCILREGGRATYYYWSAENTLKALIVTGYWVRHSKSNGLFSDGQEGVQSNLVLLFNA